MITLEAYRARIGCFHSKGQKAKHQRCSSVQSFKSGNYFSYPGECVQTFIMFVFILTLKFNINMATQKLSMLLLDGDIESNPGPVKIQKAVLGTFHQGHSKFGSTSGIQCCCNALYAICFSLVKKVSIWKSWDLDYILENGDAVFKSLGMLRALSTNELPHHIMIEDNSIEIKMLTECFGHLGQRDLFENHKINCDSNGLIFTTGGFSFSLIWSKNSIFLFDSHSRDETGAFVSTGSSVILSFKNLIDVQHYIKAEYSKQLANFDEMQYDLQYVKVTTKANTSAICNSINNCRKKIKKCEKYAESIGTPKHEEINKRKCKRRAELFGTPEHDKLKKRIM